MTIKITQSARQFGYIIWSNKIEPDMKNLLGSRSEIAVTFNGLPLGIKSIDWKYHRISLGYKHTHALPENANAFILELQGEVLEVRTINAE